MAFNFPPLTNSSIVLTPGDFNYLYKVSQDIPLQYRNSEDNKITCSA